MLWIFIGLKITNDLRCSVICKYTNILLQTDLCGIKWRKLVWGESGGGGDPLDDPVLRSYSQCIANDILCVWRRVAGTSAQSAATNLYDVALLAPPPPLTHPPLSLAAAKELWIFWYGEEPDLSELVAPELISPGKLVSKHTYKAMHQMHRYRLHYTNQLARPNSSKPW